MEQARPVDVIDTGKAKARRKDTDTAAAAAADAVAAAVPAVVEEEEEEEEYVPIDAMFRDELDVNAADGNSVRRYLCTKALACVRPRPCHSPSINMADAGVPGVVQAGAEVLAAQGAARRPPPHRRPRLVRGGDSDGDVW
jgi:hypothetical protein